ncbi:ribosome-recycling factor [Microsporum audouinii]
MSSTAQLAQCAALRSLLRNKRLPTFFPRRSIHTHTTTSHIQSFAILHNTGRRTLQPCTIQTNRKFSQSSALLKKKASKDSSKDNDKAASSGGAVEDPFDFAPLHDSIKDAVTRLKEDLAKLRGGGRVTPEAIENIRVSLHKVGGSDGGKGKKAASPSKETVRLGEVASVIPKGGRTVSILVGEEHDVKAVMSAITASDLSLNPQGDPHNPLQLNVAIPPPTKESREQTVKDAKAAMEKASNAVRNGRAALNKKLKGKEVKKARPDDVRKAIDQMEKIAEKGQKEVKDVFEVAKKALEA